MDDSLRALHESLEQVREHVLGVLDGLSDEQMHRSVLPSGWSCLGLVNHLAVDVERFWFRAVMAGEEAAWATFGAQNDTAWEVAAGEASATILARYREEIAQADTVIGSMSLDSPPKAWPEDLFGSFRLADLRAVLLHVITETACHAGHLDAARELIDRRQWVVL